MRGLLASPDDDIDPIDPERPYDRNIYHRFHRPEGWRPPRQRVLDRQPRSGDWVVVWESYRAGGAGRDLFNAEGLVDRIDGADAHVKLAGFSGLHGPRVTTIPLDHLRVMVFESYRIGSDVRVTRGEYAGERGTVEDLEGADLHVRLLESRQCIRIPQERVHLIPE